MVETSRTKGNIRASSAWLAFLALQDMPPPHQKIRSCTDRFQISARHQYFVAYETCLTSEMSNNPNVVVIRESNGDKNNDSIPGICGIYQLRTVGDTRTIQYREVACWCPSCILSDYNNCLVESKLISAILDAGISKPKRTNKCSVCKQPGHNKKSSLCVGRPADGSVVLLQAQDITDLEEVQGDDEDSEDS